MSLSAEKTALKNALETYGKQIDIEIARGVNVEASGEMLFISDADKRDNSLTITARRRNILNLGAYYQLRDCTYDATTNTITSSFTSKQFSLLRYKNLNDEIKNHAGQPITFSVKSAPEDTQIRLEITGSIQQVFESEKGATTVTGVIDENMQSVSYLDLRLNFKSTRHTSSFIFEDLQIEFGSAATEYVPYIEDLTSVTISKRGKNLFNVDKYTDDAYYAGDGVFANPDSADPTDTQREYAGIDITDIWDISDATKQRLTISFDLRADAAGQVQIYALGKKRFSPTKFVDATTEWQRFSHTVVPIPTTPNMTGDNVCTLSFYGTYGTGVIPYVKNIQIELGEEATDLEAYAGEIATPDETGTIKALTTATPSTVITSDTAGIILDALYKKEHIYTSADVVSCTPSFEGSLLTAIMQQAEIELDGVGDAEFAKEIKGEKIYITLAVTAEETARKEYGTFIVKDAEYRDDTNSVILHCYDLMIRAMTPFNPVADFTGGDVTLGSYLQAICGDIGLTLATPTFRNNTVIIDEEKYDTSYMKRDVLTEIAQAAGGTIAIKNDELYVLYPTASGVTIEPSNLKSIEIGDLYGPINSVVLARTPQEDNIYKKDGTAEKVCEIKIENNQLMDSHREDFIEGIYAALRGLTYYPHEVESYGIGVLDICDLFTIETLDGKTYTALHLSGETEITQGLVERTKGAAPKATETDYKAADTTDRKINKTILRVDKQEQTIQALAEKTTEITNEQGKKIGELTQKVEQTITPESVDIKISEAVNGINGIETETGYTFDKDGLRIKKSGEEIENLLDHTGMYVNQTNADGAQTENILTANNNGVNAVNLTARKYLIIGKNSRFEDFEGKRTACFYIGG